MFNNYIIESVQPVKFSHQFSIYQMLEALELFKMKRRWNIQNFRAWLVQTYGVGKLDVELHSGYKTYWLDTDGNINLGS